jgi:hypothetical protein
MSERERPLSLWGSWWNAIELLRPAFSRLSTFLWFATIVAGMTVRADMLGVTSIVRALNLRPALYHRLLAHFHSTGVKLDRLAALWAAVVLRLFPTALRVNGRLILIGDGIKCPKRGKKMPAVKLLHQQSDANTKPEYIMGIPCRRSASSSARRTASSPCLSQHASMKVWSGPIATAALCSTKCSSCSVSSPSRRRFTLSPMPTTPPARSLTA